MPKQVMTVRGPLDPAELGLTSMHEHVLVDLAGCFRGRFQLGERQMPDEPFTLEARSKLRHGMILSSDNLRLDDEEAAAGEVADFAEAGGSAIVDCGVPGIRTWEDVVAFQRISESTGVHIIASAGLYSEDSWPERFQSFAEPQFAEHLRGEIANGIGESGVLPGQIKVAYEGRSESADAYLRAAARVSRESGLPLQVHVGLTLTNDDLRSAFFPLLYSSECVPERTIVCHVENWLGSLQITELVRDPSSVPRDTSLHREVMDRGFNLCFTCFGAEWDTEALGTANRPDWFYVAGMVPLIESGYAGQLCVGHDVFTRSATRRGGGEGLLRIGRFVLPTLLRAGVLQRDIDLVTIENPRRLLAH